jgi:hypothetical protein
MKKYILVIIIIIGSGLWYQYEVYHPKLIKVDLPAAKQHQEFVEQSLNEDLLVEEQVTEELPELEEEAEVIKIEEEVASINLALPFTRQAPTGNWDQPYQDACEEASLLMVDYYYQSKEMPSPAEVENILTSMVAWQEANWGGHFNLPMARLVDYIDIFYDYRVEMVSDVTINQLEDFLDQGLPIIIPADGRKLDNPFFNGEGPEYHMLVIKGYVDNNFITNDPGTKRGENFIYSYENMMESIFDWETKNSSATGRRNVLVLYND